MKYRWRRWWLASKHPHNAASTANLDSVLYVYSWRLRKPYCNGVSAGNFPQPFRLNKNCRYSPIVNPQRRTGQEKIWTIELWKIRLLACLTTLYFVWVSVNNGGFHFSIKHDILGRRFASFCLLGWAWIPDGNLAGGKGPGRKIWWARGGGGGERAGGGG